MKHPSYNTTTESALNIARNLKYGPIPKPEDPVPSIDEAIEIIEEERRTCGFQLDHGHSGRPGPQGKQGREGRFHRLTFGA